MKTILGYLIGLGVIAVMIVLHGLSIFSPRRFALVDWAREDLRAARNGRSYMDED